MTLKANNYLDMQFKDYLSIDAVSQSMLKDISKCPAYFKNKQDNKIETKAMKTGRITHSYILESDKFDNEYYITKKIRRVGSEWKNILSLAKDKEIIFEEDLEEISKMKESLLNNKYFINTFNKAIKELSVFWNDPDVDISCKGRLDGYDKDRNIIFDLKTTIDCTKSAFIKQFFNLKYYLQAAFYLDGIKEITGKAPDYFIFFAVEKESPYLVSNYVVKYDSELIESGRKEYKYLLKKYKDCNKNNKFPGLDDNIVVINEAPFWHKYSNEEEK